MNPIYKFPSLAALMLLLPAPADAANLLFKSNFGNGVTVNAPRAFYTSTVTGGGGAWQDITGLDSETGFDWSKKVLGAEFMGLQDITMEPVDGTTIGDHIQNEIRQVTGPDGKLVNELFCNLKKKADAGTGGAQIPLMIKRPWDIGDVENLYITYWFKHKADLQTKLDNTVSSGNWRNQFEFKTGGYNNTYGGDYRISTLILKDKDGSLYWSSKGDNVANGPWTRVDYWRVDNKTVPVPIDRWFKFELFWHRSAGPDGRYWAAVDGQVIVDYFGPNMGDYNLPITRIMPHNTYTGGWPEVHSHMTGLEIWDGFPCGDGISCYSAKDTTAPTVAITTPTAGTTVSGTVSVQVNATDNVGVSKVELLANGTLVASTNTSPFTLSWNSKTVSNGSVSLSANAYDAAGNKASSSTVSVNVNNPDITPPVVTITSPANGATLSGSVTITSTASDDRGSAGITQFLYIDGSLKATVAGANLSYTWSSGKSGGKGKVSSHTISVTAKDAAGNSSSKSISVLK